MRLLGVGFSLRGVWEWLRARAGLLLVALGGVVLAILAALTGGRLVARRRPIPDTRPPPAPSPDPTPVVDALGAQRDDLARQAAAVAEARTDARESLAPMDADELAAEWRRLRGPRR